MWYNWSDVVWLGIYLVTCYMIYRLDDEENQMVKSLTPVQILSIIVIHNKDHLFNSSGQLNSKYLEMSELSGNWILLWYIHSYIKYHTWRIQLVFVIYPPQLVNHSNFCCWKSIVLFIYFMGGVGGSNWRSTKTFCDMYER